MKDLKEILLKVESALWFLQSKNVRVNFDREMFMASVKIVSDAMLDNMYKFQDSLDMSLADRLIMAEKFGNEFRSLIKKYTDIDTHHPGNHQSDSIEGDSGSGEVILP